MKNKMKTVLICLPLLLTSCGESENFKGFDIDLARKTSEKLGVKVKFQEIEWDMKETELASKNIDLIWNGLTITDSRKEAMEISAPYMTNQQVIVAKKDVTLNFENNYKVAFEAGSAGDDVFNDNDLFDNCTDISCETQSSALMEVKAGTSDLAIIDSVMAGWYLKEDSSFKDLKMVSDYHLTTEYYGIAARKGDKGLIAKVNETIKSLYDDGTVTNIANTYGLKDSLVTSFSNFDTYDKVNETASWEYIKNRGELIVGFTYFAPIAYIA